MSPLILFPHGLGDCILLTPALRGFYKQTGQKVHIATLKRFETAQFFKHNPYVDKIFYTKDAWHDYNNAQQGFRSLVAEWTAYAQENGLGQLIMPTHRTPEPKILLNLRALGVKSEDYRAEVYTSSSDKRTAAAIIKKLVGPAEFGFIHTHTGVPSKDLPLNFGRAFMKRHGLKRVIEIGRELGALDENINVQFEILRKAKIVCVADSVFYHACHAMQKPVNFAYFARGPAVYNRVRHLAPAKENIHYDCGGSCENG